MRKILLVGTFTEHFREMNKKLAGKYEVRACVNKLEIFRGMIKLNKPDVIVMFFNEMNKTNEEVLNELRTQHREISVVGAGIKFEEGKMPKALLSKQFEYLEEPYTAENLIDKIEFAAGKDISEEESVVEGRKERIEHRKEENQTAEDSRMIIDNIPQCENKRKSILLVDDSGIYLRMMKNLLEDTYDIMITTSGLKAITLAQEKHPDLILLDYEMPLYDGRETMIKLRESQKTKDIPIVFVTAVNEKEHIKAVLSLKPAGYLLKPINKDRVFQTIKDIVG